MRSCESCGSKMPFGVRRQKVEGQLVCDGCLNGRPGMPRTQITRKSARPIEGSDMSILSRRVARLVVAEFPPPKDDPTSDVPPNDGTDPAPDPAAAPAPGAPPAPGGDPMAQPGQPAQPSTPFAPDQQSDMVVRVCPFCGSGHLIGQSDGSIKCGYDDTVFTITVMPSHPFQPLVNPDGSPFEMPKDPDADPSPQVGQASPEVTPGAGPADLTAPTPPGQAPTEPPQGGAPAGGDPGAASPVPPAGSDFDAAFAQVMAEAGAMAAPVPEDAAAPVAEDDEKKKSTPPWMKKSSQESLYVTASGERLYENAYIRHLRETVLPKH